MAGIVSTSVREQVRAASDIVDVIGAAVPLKRAGTNFVALCPFHKEKSPSFNVSPQKQIFHCFGCHKGGDVFRFVQEFEGIDFGEALRRLAERARITLDYDQGPGRAEGRYLKEALLDMHEQITQRWQNALENDATAAPAREYLEKRGVSAEGVRLFRVGYAPDSWDDTINWARSKGFDLAQVERGGLIIRGEGDRGYYGRFRDRLMFPISDEQGRVIGFSGRVLKGNEKTAKYVNTPETPLFTKGKVFFGLHKSKRALLDAQTAVICEGQLDLIACFMAGIENVVAPQGTAFTADHARILKRYVDEVVLCFDSDAAGKAAAVRVLDHLMASGLAIRVAVVPAPHDPDSFIREQGGDAFRGLIDRAVGFFDYYLDMLCSEHDSKTDKGQGMIGKSMAEAVHKTGNLALIDRVAQKTSLRLGIGVDAMRSEFKRLSRVTRNPAPAEREDAAPEPEETIPPPNPQEYWLLKIALLHEDEVGPLLEHLDLDWIGHATVRDLFSRIRAAYETRAEGGGAALLADLENPGARSLVSEMLAENRPIPNPAQQIQDLLLRLRNRFLDARISSLNLQAGDPGLNDEQRVSLITGLGELRRQKREPITGRNPGGVSEGANAAGAVSDGM
ncbi:MAG: DNA primase [Verrucomicrobia bacterium]|nr:DNA primase [Verrucomicrobiota bacterium]